MVIMTFSDDRHEFGNMEKLMDFDMSYPTIVKIVESLSKRRCIKKIDTGRICILRVGETYHHLAAYLKSCPDQLVLFSEEPQPKRKEWWNKKDQDALIRHYALEKGVPEEKIKEWYRSNYGANVSAARRVLTYCSNLEEAKQTITNCKLERSKDGLTWSMAGDVCRNIQQFAPVPGSTGEGKKWH